MSDTASQHPASDENGTILQNRLIKQTGFTVVETVIVPDDVGFIQNQVLQWSTRRIDLIVTTGGTGFSPRDVTPEVIRTPPLRAIVQH